MMWVNFKSAAEMVERELGVSWGAAQRMLLDACNNKEIKTKDETYCASVLDVDCLRWIETKKTKQTGGKVALIIVYLTEMYPDGVPIAELCNRQDLQGKLIARDKTLSPLDPKTLKKAIDKYNASE